MSRCASDVGPDRDERKYAIYVRGVRCPVVKIVTDILVHVLSEYAIANFALTRQLGS